MTGIIVLWYGSIASIPLGWLLCDGNNGTPDLRDRFPLAVTIQPQMNLTGGDTEHQHSFTTNGHFHDIGAGTDKAAGTDIDGLSTRESDTGTTDLTGHMPRYHALAYIQKIDP